MYTKDGYQIVQDPETGEIKLLKKRTGEVVEAIETILPQGSTSYTPDEQEAYRKKREWEKRRRIWRRETKMTGSFCFVSAAEHFDGLKPESMTKLVYLSMYLNYSGCLMLTERIKMELADLNGVLDISEATVQRFLKELEGRYLFSKDGLLYLDKKTFIRGTINQVSDHSSYVKVYRGGMRALYEHAGGKYHRQIGYLFQMLPYLNIEHNILCWSPAEKDPERIWPMTLPEFCEHIGYNTRNMKRLAEAYDRIVFLYDGHEERFCSILGDRSRPETTRIQLNPHVLYSGGRPVPVSETGCFPG